MNWRADGPLGQRGQWEEDLLGPGSSFLSHKEKDEIGEKSTEDKISWEGKRE